MTAADKESLAKPRSATVPRPSFISWPQVCAPELGLLGALHQFCQEADYNNCVASSGDGTVLPYTFLSGEGVSRIAEHTRTLRATVVRA